MEKLEITLNAGTLSEEELEGIAGGAEGERKRLHFDCKYVNFMGGYVCPCSCYADTPTRQLRRCVSLHSGKPVEMVMIYHDNGCTQLNYELTVGENNIHDGEVLVAIVG